METRSKLLTLVMALSFVVGSTKEVAASSFCTANNQFVQEQIDLNLQVFKRTYEVSAGVASLASCSILAPLLPFDAGISYSICSGLFYTLSLNNEPEAVNQKAKEIYIRYHKSNCPHFEFKI